PVVTHAQAAKQASQSGLPVILLVGVHRTSTVSRIANGTSVTGTAYLGIAGARLNGRLLLCRTSRSPVGRAPTAPCSIAGAGRPWGNARSAPAFQLLRGAVTRFGFRELRLGPCQVSLVGNAFQRFFGALLGGKGSRLVQLLATQRGIGKDRNEVRLDLEHAAGDIEEVFLAVHSLHPDLAGLQSGQQRRVAWRDADFAHARGRVHHVGVAGENLALRGNDVDLDRGHQLEPSAYCIVFARSTASSVEATMQSACSGRLS